jgi:hypothetical protein
LHFFVHSVVDYPPRTEAIKAVLALLCALLVELWRGEGQANAAEAALARVAQSRQRISKPAIAARNPGAALSIPPLAVTAAAPPSAQPTGH